MKTINKQKTFTYNLLTSLILASTTMSIQVNAEEENQEVTKRDNIEKISVTGFRSSLNDAILSKRAAVGNRETIAAEDIGKFPDLNLAESLQRTSGIAITRDNGEGQQISLRGLGPSFARVLWNGVPISTASNGGTDVGASNREFDFDVFSSDLFSRIDIDKTTSASQVEGGIAGVVNLRNFRPFDFDGFKANYSVKMGYQELSEETDPSANFIISNTFADDKFGALFGLTYSERSFRVDGFETFDFVSQSANGFTFDTTAGNQSGLTDTELNNMLLPRLPRTELQYGTRERTSFLAAFQFRPHDDLEFSLDILGANLDNNFDRHNFDAEIRSQNDLVPLNASVNSNNRVSEITLLNANRRSENRIIGQETEQLHIALSSEWYVNDSLQINAVASHAKSEFDRRQTTFLARANDTQITLNIPDGSQPIPQISTTADLSDPSIYDFDLIRVEPFTREEINTAFHIDAIWGDSDSNITFGIGYDTLERDNVSHRASGNPADFIDNIPAFSQLVGSVPVDDYLAILGAGGTPAANPTLIDTSVVTDFFDLDVLDQNAPLQESGTGTAEEKTFSAYAEANHTSDFFDMQIRMNSGIRYVSTDTDVSSPFSGTPIELSSHYSHVLPSFNVALDVTEDITVKFSGGRALTRPDIAALIPNTNVQDDFTVRSGNPDLKPFISDQADASVEWYFDDESLFAISYYHKDINGFIQNATSVAPFGDAGIPLSILDPQIFVNLTLDTPVDFSRPENVPDSTIIQGVELLYQQPLDFIAEGAGLLFNYSKIKGDTSFMAGDVEVPSNIVGLSENNYNFVLYYENDDFSVRGSWNFRDDFVTNSCCRNNQPLLRTREGSGQLDLSATYNLPFSDNLTLSFEAINVNENDEYTYFGNTSQLQRLIGSGRQFFFGLRGGF